jgi:N-acyl-D-amino-acid deacylase
VFDPLRVRDVVTYAEPHAFSEGIERVYVNGMAVLEGGSITGATPAGCFVGSGRFPWAGCS